MTTIALKSILATCFVVLAGGTFAQNPCQPPIPPTVLPPLTLCAEETPFTLPWGTQVSVSGTYSTTLVAAAGCDSVVRQTIIVKPFKVTQLAFNVDCGNTLVEVCGEIYTAPGLYTAVCSGADGCDSTVVFSIISSTPPFPFRGRLYFDANSNNGYDNGEQVFPNTIVRTSTGQVAHTNANGLYAIQSLNPGDTIFLPFGAPAGISLPSFHVYEQGRPTCYDFKAYPLGVTASGTVFYDLDANGVVSPGDPREASATIRIAGKSSTLTNQLGEYAYLDVSAGDTIAAVLPAGASAVWPAFYLYDPGVSVGYDFVLTPKPVQPYGYVFWDLNGDGTQNAGETRIPGVQVFAGSGAMTVTDSNGQYLFSTSQPVGDTIRVVVPDPNSFSVPGFYVVKVGNPGPYPFGITPPGGQHNLRVSVVNSGPFRPGFSNQVIVNVTNIFGNVPDTRLEVVLPAFLTIEQTSIAPDQQNGDTLVWFLGALSPAQSRQVIITVKTQIGTPLATQVSIHSAVYPLAGDLDVQDNTDKLQGTVVGSFDPNDKQVTPAYLLPDEAELRPSLVYTVRFQNTGNYPADFVIIRDTLSDDLDLASFRFIGASHPCTWEILPGKILVVHFTDINLPDSLSNEPESHGFVRFSIRPRAAFPLGHTVKNAASIYFDFNDPIHTNTATTQVVYFLPGDGAPPETGAMIVRPNPASWTFYAAWKNPAPEGSILRLLDLRGLPFFQLNLDAGQTNAAIDVSYIPEGVYLLVLEGPGLVLRKKVVVLREGPPRRD